MSFKVLASDGLHPSAIEKFEKDPQFELTVRKGLSPEKLLQESQSVDFLVIRSATTLGAQVLSALPNLKGIVRAGVGVDNIDLKASTDLGISVWNAPSGNFQSTAELAMGHIFSLFRSLPDATVTARQGVWAKKELSAGGRQIKDSALGVFGAGNIGQRLAAMGKSLGMKVLVCDPFWDPPAELGYVRLGFEEFLKTADVISIHSPLMDSTKGIFNRQAFSQMKNSAYLVNAARGGIVNEAELIEALDAQEIAGAAIDVFEKEPFSISDPHAKKLLGHPRIYFSPHIGAATQQAQEAVGLECYEKLKTLVESLEGISSRPPTLNNVIQSRI